MSFFQTITEDNKHTLNKPADSDIVYYSELKEWHTHNAFRSFSIKYVVDSFISYKVDNKEHVVSKGNFLLACKQPDVNAYFKSKNTVKSICIDICPATVAEAYTVITAKNDYNFDDYLSGYFKAPYFFEKVCNINTAGFGQKLNTLFSEISKGHAKQYLTQEWFLDLVEKVIYYEYGNYLALNGIHSVKLATKKEILSRLMTAKQYMDETYLTIKEIKEVAIHSNMSEFHFFRSFKQAFSISPYQYLLTKRLELARNLIAGGSMSITEIAFHCNFPDLFTFSKAFRRHFDVAPSHLVRKKA